MNLADIKNYKDKFNKVSAIYLITFNNNNKKLFYVGSAVNVYIRIRDHYGKLLKNTHHNNKLQNYFNKYGSICFTVDILTTVHFKNQPMLLELEQNWINIYKVNELFNSELTVTRLDYAGLRSKQKCSKETPRLIHIFTKDIIEPKYSIAELGRFMNIPPGKIYIFLNGKYGNLNGYVRINDYPDGNLPTELPRSEVQIILDIERKEKRENKHLTKSEQLSRQTPKFYNLKTKEITKEFSSRKKAAQELGITYNSVVSLASFNCKICQGWKIYNPETDK